jgi:hypothetical protein
MKFSFIPIVLIIFIFCHLVHGQDSKKEKAAAQMQAIKQRVDDKRYGFLAQSVSPMSGGMRQLTSLYTLMVWPDTVICDLPYFGRVYQPSSYGSDDGIQFSSTNFEYTSKERKKGGWEIKIEPKDIRNAPQVFLSISPDGYAVVRVNSSDRQAISYNGRIEEIKPKRK